MPDAIRRPEWWTKDGLVGVLRKDPGVSIASLIRRASEEAGLSDYTLREEVATWERTDAAFREALYGTRPGEVLKRNRSKRNGQKVIARNGPLMTEKEKANFLAHLRETGRELDAARVAGVEWSDVKRLLDPKNVRHDPGFLDGYNEALEYNIQACRDAVMGSGVEQGNAAMGLKILERRRPNEWSPTQNIRHGGTVEHRVGLSVEAEKRLIAELRQEWGELFPKSESQLPRQLEARLDPE